jgi:hypothetical protein
MLGGWLGAQEAKRTAMMTKFKKHRALLFPLCLSVVIKIVLNGLNLPGFPLGLFIIFTQDHSQ